MVTIFIKKYSKRRPITVDLEGWRDDSADERLERTIAAWPSKHFRFEGERTVYRYGSLTIVFDAYGKAIEGYSYDACLFAFAPPSEDFPEGRLIWNDTSYSPTTNSRHRYPCMNAARGMVTGKKEVTYPWSDGEVDTVNVRAQWDHAMVVHNMPWRCSPSTLLNETQTWYYAGEFGEASARHHAYIREQRAEAKRDKVIAQGKHLRLVTGGAA